MLNSTLSLDNNYSALDKRLSETKKRFFEQSSYFLTHERRFFKDHAYPILLRRAQGIHVASSDEIWKTFNEQVSSILLDSPECFVKHCKFPYIKTLLSIKAIELRRLKPEKIDNLHWFGKGLFIDASDSNETKIATEKSVSVISNVRSLMAPFIDTAQQYAIREVILALTDTYNIKTATFTGNWRERIQHRITRKQDQKKKYLDSLSNIWSSRNIAEGIKTANIHGINTQELLGERLSKAKWKRYVQYEIAHYFLSKGCTKSSDIQREYYPIELAIRLFRREKPEVFNELSTKILKSVEHVKRSFPIAEHDIEKTLVTSFRSRMSTFDIKDAAFHHLYTEASKERMRISRMKLAKATKMVYLEAINYHSFIIRFNSKCSSVLVFHKALSLLGVSESACRNFIKTIYNEKLWLSKDTDKYLHDLSTDLIPALSDFVKRLKVNPKHKQIHNSVIKLITSQIAGGSFNTNILSDLLSLNYCKVSCENTKINSLNQLVSNLLKNDSRLNAAMELSQALNIKTVPERDITIIAGMRLTTLLSNYLKQLNPITTSEHEPLIDHIGALNLAVLPHDHLLGILGAGVPGVCIDFGSSPHFEHLGAHCRNLVVYDENRVLLWGLLVEASCGQWYLNNFQGSLPSSQRKHSRALVKAVHTLLGQLGNVYLLDFYFNAMSLCEGLEEIEDINLCLPKMRLDIDQDSEGNLEYNDFYKIPSLIEIP